MRVIAAVVATLSALFAAPLASAAGDVAKPGTPGGAPMAKLVDAVIWGSQLETPAGGLAFGGQDQTAGDGRPHTRVLRGGKWQPIVEQLRAANPLQAAHDELRILAGSLQGIVARARYIYFQGREAEQQRVQLDRSVKPQLAELRSGLRGFVEALDARADLPSYEAGQVSYAKPRLVAALEALRLPAGELQSADVGGLRNAGLQLQRAAEAFDAEPPPRAASPLAFDSKTGLYFVFGGDHFDYLANDVWLFDPRANRWAQRHPKTAPPPRANHQVEAAGDGTVAVWSGYTYLDKFAYGVPPYQHLDTGRWEYDITADRWRGPAGAKPAPANTRQYRSARFLPEFYLAGERPNAAKHAQRLASLPANTWVSMQPPLRPQREQIARDWGTSVMSSDHDLFLQWGGGHSAHCGTDVLHYHFATNRWEQPYPIEMCLGQQYSTAHYPGGNSFNGNPWMIMHAYKSYAYDDGLTRLVLTGRTHNWKYHHDPYYYLYDPLKGDWTDRHPLHPQTYQAQYFLNSRVHSSSHGVLMWGKGGTAFRLNRQSLEFEKLEFDGTLPTAGTDGGGMIFDPPRNRMLAVTKPWKSGGGIFNGQIHALDLAAMRAAPLSPAGMTAVAGILLREPAYNAEHDLFLWSWLDRKKKGRMAVYDPNGNRWMSLAVAGDAPFGVSTGHVYDERRRLHWVTDNKGNVFALRLDPATADLRPL